jgi:hypothetical protein
MNNERLSEDGLYIRTISGNLVGSFLQSIDLRKICEAAGLKKDL